jgi:DNA-binding protein H-NS
MARSYDVIQAEILKLQQEAEEARSQRNEAIKRIRAEMTRFGIAADDLREPVPARRGGVQAKNRAVATGASAESPAVRLLEAAGIDFRRKAPATAAPPAQGKLAPRYRDPRTGATWSGHARPPAWIKDAKDRSVFLIEKNEAPVAHEKPTKKAATSAARTTPEKVAPSKVAARGSGKARGSSSRQG